MHCFFFLSFWWPIDLQFFWHALFILSFCWSIDLQYFFSAWLKNLDWEWSLVECFMLKCFECIFECLLSVWSFKYGLKHNLVFLLQSVHPFSSSIIICPLSVSPIFSFGKYQSLYFRSDLRYVSVLDGKRYDHLREGLAFFKYKNRETDSG